MTITETARGYELQFEFRPNIVAEVKNMPGHRFFGKEKGWMVPHIAERKNADGSTTKFYNKEAMERFKKKYLRIAPGADAPESLFKIEELPELKVVLPWREGVAPFNYQARGIAAGMLLKRFINADMPGLGKEQGITDKVLTPTGWSTMGKLKAGDYVIGSDGKPTKVLQIFPQGEKQLYRISFSDGFSVTAGAEHLWSVQKSGTNDHYVLTTAQMAIPGSFIRGKGHQKKWGTYIKDADGKCRFKIPIVKPVEYSISNKLLIEPYLLGLFLGDGHSGERSATLTLFEKDFADFEPFLSHYTSISPKEKNSCYTVHLNEGFRASLKYYGLHRKLHDYKHIPSEYLIASPNERLAILQGLMDSDGNAADCATEFSTTSKMLCDGIVELVQSLGGIARVRVKEKPVYKYKGQILIGKKAYRVNIKLQPGMNPFRCKRKASAYMEPYHYLPERYIRDIQPDRIEESVCIMVDAADHLYVTDHYIVTHNTFQTIGTVLGLEVIGEPAFPVLVICPATLRENWRREWEEKFTHKRALLLTDQNKNTWHQYYRMRMADVFIVNYESLKKYFVISMGTGKKGEQITLKNIKFNPTIALFKTVILDESHRLKDPSTLQGKLCRGIAAGKPNIIELTGTPVVNKPKDLASQLAIIEQIDKFGGWKYFVDRYCEGGNGSAYSHELNGKLNKYCFFRREKKDVLHDLPDKMREIITCDITTRVEYNMAKNDLKKYLEQAGYTSSQVDKSMNGEIMVQIGKLKAISARGKLPEAIEHIQEVVDAGEKIVVFIHQKFMADAIMKEFPGSVSVRGMEIGEDGKERPQSAENRQRSVDRFQNDASVQVIVCSIKAAGVGITLTASSRLVFLELPWHAADVEQCEDRIHRIGQKNSAQISYFLGKNTIDEDIYKLIEEKRKVSDAITGTTTDISTIITDLSRSLFNQRV